MTISSVPGPNADSAASAALVQLKISDVRVVDRLRKVLADRASTMAADFKVNGQIVPIDVVETEGGLRLIDGAVRIVAALENGDDTITAIVHSAGTFGSELDIRLREISENFVRFDLTALERAVYIAEWRAIHEQKFPPAKRGRKAKTTADELSLTMRLNSAERVLDEQSAEFALNFTETVQRTLGLSRAVIFRDLKIASLPADIRDLIAGHAIADKHLELLALVDAPGGMLAAIVALLLESAGSVADAIAILEQRPLPSKLDPHQKLSEGFARLKPEHQFLFFDLHTDAIDRWRVERRR